MASTPSKHAISFDSAKTMIRKYQDSVPATAQKSCFFTRDAFDTILADPNIAGIRIYYAIDDKGTTTFVLAGQNNTGNIQNGTLMELGTWCPPICDFTDDFLK